jgi:hypothetical protein
VESSGHFEDLINSTVASVADHFDYCLILINQVIRHLFIFLFIILFGSNLILFGID